MKTIVNWQLPIKTCPEGDPLENIWAKARRHRIQKQRIFQQFIIDRPLTPPFPCHVILTRIAPRKLDKDDNLPYSLKWIKDAVSEKLTGITQAGRADGDDRITWEYKQKKGDKPREYAVQIEIMSN